MPPQTPPTPMTDTSHLLPPHKRSFGPAIGAGIIVIVLAFGALYFWGAYLNDRSQMQVLPYIPGDVE